MVDALGHDRIDVLGVSLGGVIAQQLAHQAPDLVRRLVLAATGPGVSAGRYPGRRRRCSRWPPAPLPPAGLLPADRRTILRRPGPHRSGRAAARLGRPVRQAAQPARLSRPALRHQRLDRPSLAAALRQPTLVLTGDDDPIIPVLNGRILATASRAPAARRPRRRPPVPARAPGRDAELVADFLRPPSELHHARER